MANWYYSQNGKVIGPIDEQDMRQWVKERSISPAQLVCREGTEDWQRLDYFREVFAPDAQRDLLDSIHVKPEE
jgi:hypothetical protein